MGEQYRAETKDLVVTRLHGTLGQMPEIYLNLLAVSLAQVAVLGVVVLSTSARLTLKRTILLVLAGAALGSAYDIVIGGVLGVFTYASPNAHPVLFIIANGLLSYGVAMLTAAAMPVAIARRRMDVGVAAFLIVSLLVCLGLLLAYPNASVRAVVLGIALIAASELLAALCGRVGPFRAAAFGTYAPLALLAFASASCAAVYEAANAVFPVWQWNVVPGNPLVAESALIAVGYLALFHPMVTIAQVLMPAGADALPDK